MFKEVLGTPVIWIPNSYAGCGQHGPDEHALGSLLREGLGLMAGIWWDIGERRGASLVQRTHIARLAAPATMLAMRKKTNSRTWLSTP